MDDPGLILKGLAGLCASLTAIWGVLELFAKRIQKDTTAAISSSASDIRKEIEASKVRILERTMSELELMREKHHHTDLIAQEARTLANLALANTQRRVKNE
jgi:hypothetical protein